MKVSELIFKLEYMKRYHGDIDVKVSSGKNKTIYNNILVNMSWHEEKEENKEDRYFIEVNGYSDKEYSCQHPRSKKEYIGNNTLK